MDAHLFGSSSVCVRARVFPRGAPARLSSPRPATRYKTAQRAYSSDMLCETQQIRDRQPWPARDTRLLKEMSVVGGPWQANRAPLVSDGGTFGGHYDRGWVMELTCPSLLWGKDTNRRNKCVAAKDTGSCAWCGAYRVTWGLNLFSVSMTDLIAIPFTHGQAIYRLFSLGDYLYMNKCQRIGYLLQGALQYDWLARALCSRRFREPTVPPCVRKAARHAASKSIYLGFLLKRGEEIKWTLKSEPPSASVKPRVILDGCSEIPPEWRVDPEGGGSQSANLSPTNHTQHRQSTLQIHSACDTTAQSELSHTGGGR